MWRNVSFVSGIIYVQCNNHSLHTSRWHFHRRGTLIIVFLFPKGDGSVSTEVSIGISRDNLRLIVAALNYGQSMRKTDALVFIGDLVWQVIMRSTPKDQGVLQYTDCPDISRYRKESFSEQKFNKPCLLRSFGSQHASWVKESKVFKLWNSECTSLHAFVGRFVLWRRLGRCIERLLEILEFTFEGTWIWISTAAISSQEGLSLVHASKIWHTHHN